MIWKPNVTVAAIIERDGKFLLVEEETADGIMFNQPAGHLENGETLLAVAGCTLAWPLRAPARSGYRNCSPGMAGTR